MNITSNEPKQTFYRLKKGFTGKALYRYHGVTIYAKTGELFTPHEIASFRIDARYFERVEITTGNVYFHDGARYAVTPISEASTVRTTKTQKV